MTDEKERKWTKNDEKKRTKKRWIMKEEKKDEN